ncbi:siroheme synthase CysG [Kiloniella sp. b19]|uniref:siroheme synthase CysG n=1 Tax=Kiloniella sp. GXU_MW_B19 TaxID=3141326 RepID=UPI0031D427A7
MEHFPIFFGIKQRHVLLVGGGDNAVRKVRLLRKADPVITVVAPSLCDELQQMAMDGAIVHVARKFQPEDVIGKALVFAATDLDDVDLAVTEAARAHSVPVNAVDKPGISDFITPAIVDRSPLVVAICSSGAAPIVVRNLREKLEAMLHPSLGRLVSFADSFRGAVRATRQSGTARRRFWERFFSGSIADNYLAGREQLAHEQMLKLVNTADRSEDLKGHVAIVGAGPGDPDLLTFRAMRFMQQADVVVYDRLLDDSMLEYVRRDADRIYVGKAPGKHAMTQEQINRLLVDEALSGRRVVRLKGGDPFIFGRGGEELDLLREHGVDVDIVPGVTAATGCAASAAIPLTHREHASMVTFVAGHAGDGIEDADWASLVNSRQTLVFYMGVGKSSEISARLIRHGMDAQTPAAFVENGTRKDQRVIPGRLADLEKMVQDYDVKAPALIVVGKVADYARLQLAQPDAEFEFPADVQFAE